MQYGLDYLGAPKYADLVLREHPEGWMFRTFTNVFGDALPLVEKIAKSGRAPRIGLNLAWKDDHNFTGADVSRILKEGKRFIPIIKSYPEITWYVSGATEHTMNAKDATFLAAAVLMAMPQNIYYVNNPWAGKGAFITGSAIINEVHGADAKPPNVGGEFGFSFDGSSCVDSDVEAIKTRFARAQYIMLWHPAFNGRLKSDDKTPRPQRKSWPTSDLIDSLIYLHRDCGEVKLPKGYLWKSHADRHNTPPEPRAYKPVLIAPSNARRFELVANNGQVVAVSSASQPFADGRRRYYFDSFGYQIAEKARRIQGNSIVWLRADGKAVGKLNPAFRAGDFRG